MCSNGKNNYYSNSHFNPTAVSAPLHASDSWRGGCLHRGPCSISMFTRKELRHFPTTLNVSPSVTPIWSDSASARSLVQWVPRVEKIGRIGVRRVVLHSSVHLHSDHISVSSATRESGLGSHCRANPALLTHKILRLVLVQLKFDLIPKLTPFVSGGGQR